MGGFDDIIRGERASRGFSSVDHWRAGKRGSFGKALQGSIAMTLLLVLALGAFRESIVGQRQRLVGIILLIEQRAGLLRWQCKVLLHFLVCRLKLEPLHHRLHAALCWLNVHDRP